MIPDTTRWEELILRPNFQMWLGKSRTSAKTISAYLSDIHQYELWFQTFYGEDFTPDKLTSHDIRAWREHTLYTEKRSPATWNRRKASMAVYCDYCREIGAISPSFDPMRNVQPAEAVLLPPRWLDPAEYGRVIRWMEHAEARANTVQRKADARRDVAMVGLMLFAALREGEVVTLTMDDILVSERKGKVIIRKGKGGKYGEVPLSLEAREALRSYLHDVDNVDAPLFPISTRQVQNIVADLGRECGIDDLTPHRFRHTCIKRMLDAGKDPQAVQAIARHAKFSQTAEYAKAGWNDMVAAVEGVSMGRKG